MPLFLDMDKSGYSIFEKIDKPLHLSSSAHQQTSRKPSQQQQHLIVHTSISPYPFHITSTHCLQNNNMPNMHTCPEKRKGNCRRPIVSFGVFHCPKHQTVCGKHTTPWPHTKNQDCVKCDKVADYARSSSTGEQSGWKTKPLLRLHMSVWTAWNFQDDPNDTAKQLFQAPYERSWTPDWLDNPHASLTPQLVNTLNMIFSLTEMSKIQLLHPTGCP